MLQWRVTKCSQSATDLRVMAIRSYHILAHGYQVLCKGGLVYQVTMVIRAMKHDVLIPFFPDLSRRPTNSLDIPLGEDPPIARIESWSQPNSSTTWITTTLFSVWTMLCIKVLLLLMDSVVY
jgi:hypothetical protein